jgi:hypothetical protein
MRTFKRTHRRACTHSGIHLFFKFKVRGTFYTIIRAARAGGAGVEETEGDGDDECDSVVLCVCVCMCVCVCVCVEFHVQTRARTGAREQGEILKMV